MRRLDADVLAALSEPGGSFAEDNKQSQAPLVAPETGSEKAEPEESARQNKTPDSATESVVTNRVRQMYLNDELTEHEISSALASGGQEFVIYAIALKSKTPVDVVSRAMSMRSGKAIVALCWKSGLSIRLATRVQMHLAHIPPSDVLRANESEDFPLSHDENALADRIHFRTDNGGIIEPRHWSLCRPDGGADTVFGEHFQQQRMLGAAI